MINELKEIKLLKKLDIKTEALIGFEIYLDFFKETKKKLKDQKSQFEYSDYQFW